jgi:HK97 family phage portal protein
MLAGGGSTHAGVTVNEETALKYGVVFACVKILAETVAMLPLILYRRLPRGKERAIDDPLYHVLHDSPNPEMTSMEWRETMQGHLGLWGNAYSEIVWHPGRGYASELWPLRPDRVRPERKDGILQYHITLRGGGEVALPSRNVLHLRGLGGDGTIGWSPIRMARESIALGLAMEEFGARFFGAGTHPGAVVEHPGKLGDIAEEHLRKSLTTQVGGLGRSHRLLILEEGMKLAQIGIPPGDAQFLESRAFSVIDIARIFRIPPYLLQDFSRATFSNIEHTAISFVVYTMMPWLVRWEQRLKKSLLEEQDSNLFVEFLVAGLMRGDMEARFKSYAIARQWGWMSPNDVLEKENENPVEGLDTYLTPINMVATEAGKVVAERKTAAALMVRNVAEKRAIEPARARLSKVFLPLFINTVGGVVQGDIRDVRRKLKAGLDGFEKWVTERFADDGERAGQVIETMQPLIYTYTEAIHGELQNEIGREPEPELAPEMQVHVSKYTEILARDYVSYSRRRLTSRIREADAEEALDEELTKWDEKRAEELAGRETVQVNGVMTRLGLGVLLITRMVWRAIGGNPCPYCSALNGKVVGTESSFVGAGDMLVADGIEPFKVSGSVRNPPLHSKPPCQCIIEPETG